MRTYPGGDTVYCAMLSIKSHTSWSHYSKVFFVKGKRGKRASRFSSAVSGRAPPERPKERQQEESRGQNDREKGDVEEHEREKERWSANRTAKSTHTQTPERKIEARTKHAMISQSSDVLLSCGGFWMVARSSLCLLLIPPASRSYEDCTLFQASIILKCGIASFLVCAYLPPVLFQIRTWSFVCASMVF